jgi:hypothetical protein
MDGSSLSSRSCHQPDPGHKLNFVDIDSVDGLVEAGKAKATKE